MWLLKMIIFCAVFASPSVSSLDTDKKGGSSRKTLCRKCFETKNVSCIVNICDCNDCSLMSANRTTNKNGTNLHYYESLSPPHLHCQDENMFVFEWKTVGNTSYFLEYTAYDKSEYTNVTYNGYGIIKNLQSKVSYVIQLISLTLVDREVVLRRSRPISIRTLNQHRTPFPVSRIYLDSFSLLDDGYSALIKWNPAKDKSCYYYIVWFSQDNVGDYKEIEINDPLSSHKVNISGLEFSEEYLLMIRSISEGISGRRESSEMKLLFTTPSCLETYNNLENCTPETPRDLIAEEIIVDIKTQGFSIYDVHLSWSKPNLTPEFYIAYIYNYLKNDSDRLNITGASTEATYKNIELGLSYQLSLVAHSKKGSSSAVTLYRYINETRISPLIKSEPWISIEVILILSFPFVIVGLALILVCNHCLVKKMSSKYFKEMGEKNTIVNYTVTGAPVQEESDEWEIQPEKLLIKDLLGEGAFGIVRRGCFITENENNLEVAIKMLRDSPTQEELKQFYQEIDIMKSVPPHPHLVSLVGCITRGNSKWPLLVVEYCSKGDLQSYLRSAWDKLTNPSIFAHIEVPNTKYASNILYDLHRVYMEKNIPQAKDLISFARQITLGMEYLSSLKVIHRDLAARNILICENNTIKISDFGLSRDIYHNNVYCKTTGGKLPVRWMALESITHQIYTTHSDVWSFGILLWEIVTMGSTPYPGVATKDLLLQLKNGYRMEKPSNCSDELYSLMCRCWKATPRERPTFSELRNSLDLILQRVSLYLDLNISENVDISLCKKNEINNYKNINLPERYVKKEKVY